MKPEELFSPFSGYEAVVVAFAACLERNGIALSEVPGLYKGYMDGLMVDMVPTPTPQAKQDVTRQPAGQADREYRLGACPKCGGEVWGIKKCPHISPPWRTFLACDNETCGYHGKSRLTIEALRRRWPNGVEVD